MVKLQPAHLQNKAQSLLNNIHHNPKTLVLLHAGVSLGVSLLISVLNYILEYGIAETGGLSGMGLRSVLASAQAILELASSLLLPFWNIGLLFVALHWARGEGATPTHLLQGFRRFSTFLGLFFVLGGIFLGLGIALFYVSYMLFMFTPYSTPFLEKLQPILDASATQSPEELLTPALMAEITKQMTPLLILFGVVFALVAIPAFYRIRFAQYRIMEGEGTVKSIAHSVHITKGNVLQIVKLDLSFWWFYLLQALTVALCYGDQLLPALGISLPFSPGVSFFLFYVLGIALQCALLWQYQAKVSTAYCLAYRELDPLRSEII